MATLLIFYIYTLYFPCFKGLYIVSKIGIR